MNFEVDLIFLIKPLFLHDQKVMTKTLLNHGLILKKVHGVIETNKKALLKSYIHANKTKSKF